MPKLPSEMVCERSDRRLRIAIVYSRIPLPMTHADQLTVAHLLSYLHKRGHEVDLYALSDSHGLHIEELKWLQEHTTALHLFKQTTLRKLMGMVGAIARGKPLQVGYFYNRQQGRALNENVAKGQYDVVYTYYLRSAEASRNIARTFGPRPTTYLALQLSQSLNTKRISQNSPSLFSRLLYWIESPLVGRYEAEIWKSFHRAVLIGSADVEAIQAECRRRGKPLIDNWIYGAHGTDVRRFRPAAAEVVRRHLVVFSGVMKTPTNVQAVQWFCRNVWPRVKANLPTATFHIVGRSPSAAVMKLAEIDGVQVVGTVPDTATYIAQAQVCVNPMQAGGGMQNKLIEYLASGKAVVATNVANEGIGAPETVLRIANDPERFATELLALLQDPERCLDLGTRAREYAVQNWTWESHFGRLETEFMSSLTV